MANLWTVCGAQPGRREKATRHHRQCHVHLKQTRDCAKLENFFITFQTKPYEQSSPPESFIIPSAAARLSGPSGLSLAGWLLLSIYSAHIYHILIFQPLNAGFIFSSKLEQLHGIPIPVVDSSVVGQLKVANECMLTYLGKDYSS